MQPHLGELLVGQLEFYWAVHLRPRLEGLTDEEYFWEPVADCWSVRRGANDVYILDGQRPAPAPPPVTTIAWRLVHLGAMCLGNRANAFFGDADLPGHPDMFDPRYVPAPLPGGAVQGIAFLEETYGKWHDGIAALDENGLGLPLGPKGGPYADDSMAALIVHINREVMHHGGEIGLLRDLYRAAHIGSRHTRLVPVG